MTYKKMTPLIAVLLLIIFCFFVLLYERFARNEAQLNIEKHALIISDALWNFNSQGVSAYLSLACRSSNYKQLVVTDTEGSIFQEVIGEAPRGDERILVSLDLIPEVRLISNVAHDGKTIGRIEAIWFCDTIYSKGYVLFALMMLYVIIYLNARLLHSKQILETRVRERTSELKELNVSLKAEVAEHRQAKKALQQSEKRTRTIIDAISDVIYTHDLEGRFISVNPALCKAFGYEENQLIGRPISDFMKPEFTHFFSSEYLDRIKKKGRHEGTSIFFKKNGEKIYIENLSVLIQEEDSGSFISGTGRDVTERILSDRKVAKLQGELAQALKMESIGTLAGGVAHDFNNILGIIVGNTELALEDVPEWSPAHANLEEIRTAGIRATNIVRQLLSFSRKIDQKVQPIEIASVIKDALTFLRSTIPTTIDIKQDIQTTDETILADPTQINQVMMNLCINASHAMEQTGGILAVSVGKVTLDDRSIEDYPSLRCGRHVKIAVSDTGPGIDPKIIDRIFDPYFTTKGVGKGSGMGLAVVRGIVKSHNGSISVDSKPGKGTTFNILFPLAEAKTAVETETTQELPRGSETILFVDDEISIASVVRRMLERLGYQVETAMTPTDALEQFRSDPDRFDLVVTDMTMPQMTGVQLSEKLMEIREDTPIIICTGHSSLVDEKKAKELGLAAYVMKPINLLDISQIVRKVLDSDRECR